MYKIYVDNELIWANTTPDAGITSAKISLQTNSEQSFEYTVAKDYPAYNKYKMMTSVIDIYQDNETDPIFEGRPIKEAVDFYGTKTITCEGALGYLNDSIQRPHNYTGQSISNILGALLDIHNQQVEDYKKIYLGNVTVVDTTDEKIYSGGTSSSTTTDYYNLYPTNSDTTGTSGTTLTTDYVSTYEAITNLLVNNLAGYLNIRYEDGKKYLDYLKEYLPNEGQTILFGSNMLDLSSTIDYTNICTGVLPLGYSQTSEANDAGLYPSSSTTSISENKLTITSVNGGSDILWNTDAVNNFGRIIKKVEWSNVKDANTLKEKANNYLTNTQYDNLTLDCKIVDLHFVDKNVTPLHFLHMVRVVSKPHGMDREFPISSMEIDLMSPANDTVTLGQTYNSISGKVAGAETSISSTRNDISNIQTTVNNNSTTNWTNITKTNDDISIEAHARETADNNEAIAREAAIKVSADSIKTSAKQYTDGKLTNYTKLTQTPTNFNLSFNGTNTLDFSYNVNSGKVDQSVNIGDLKVSAANVDFTASNFSLDADKIDFSTRSKSINLNSSSKILVSSEDGFKKIIDGHEYTVVSTKTFVGNGSKLLRDCIGKFLSDFYGITTDNGYLYIQKPVKLAYVSHGDKSDKFLRRNPNSYEVTYTDKATT